LLRTSGTSSAGSGIVKGAKLTVPNHPALAAQSGLLGCSAAQITGQPNSILVSAGTKHGFPQ
jgi:hypothetical protein